jgi:hypothetical protein
MAGLKFENLNYVFENVNFWHLYLRTEMDNPSSNFTGSTMQCGSIDRYPEISTLMLYATVNATSSPKKRLTGVVY